MNLPKELTTVTPLSKTLALIVFFTLPAIGFFAGVRYQMMISPSLNNELSPIYTSSPEINNNSSWKLYKSTKAKFSFQHPLSWPVASASDDQLKNLNAPSSLTNSKDIEEIIFDKTFYPNAGGSKLGYISVMKIDKVNSLEDYIKTIDRDMSFNSVKGRVSVPPPKIVHMKIAGLAAIEVTDKSSAANLSPENKSYRIFKNGWVYIIASTYYTDMQNNGQIFQKIISTIQFD